MINNGEEPCQEHWELLEKKQNTQLDDLIEKELLKHELVVLHGELNEENASKLTKKLLFLQCKKAKKITVILNSVGGELFHGLLVYDTLKQLEKAKILVEIQARGLCASMACIILQAASPGMRKASAQTRFLLHEISSVTYGKSSVVKDESIELEKCNLMLEKIILERTKIKKEELEKNTKRKDWWLSAEEALKYRIIDEII